MKKHSWLPVLILIIMLLMVATPVLAYTYYATIRVQESGGNNYVELPLLYSVNNTYIADNHYSSNVSMLDARVTTAGGVELPIMVADNKTLFSVALLANQIKNLLYTLGNSLAGAFSIITGYNGYFTVSDNTNIELGDNFTISQRLYVDTTQVGANITNKSEAIRTYLSTSSNITTDLYSAGSKNNLDFVAANTDWVDIADQTAFSFTNGAGVDKPFSVSAWVNLDVANVNQVIVGKLTPAASYEWVFMVNSDNKLRFNVGNTDFTALVGRLSNVLAGYLNTWVHFAATYSGNESATGVNMYVNGIDADTTDFIAGAYTGMTNTTSKVSIGAYGNGTTSCLDGGIVEVKIYPIELTPAQVLADMAGDIPGTLVAYYRIDEGVGNTITDSSENGYNGTNDGAEWDTDFDVSGVRTVITSINVGGLSSGEKTVIVYENGVNAWMTVNGVPSANKTAVAVLNNNNNWQFMSKATPYMVSCNISKGGILQAWYQPNTMILGNTLIDRQGGDNNGTITWGSNPATVSVVVGSLISSGQPGVVLGAEFASPDTMLPTELTDWYEPTPTLTTHPFYPFINMVHEQTDFGINQIWIILAVVTILVAMVLTFKYLHHLFIVGIAGLVISVYWWNIQVLPFWIMIIFGFMILASVIWERTVQV